MLMNKTVDEPETGKTKQPSKLIVEADSSDLEPKRHSSVVFKDTDNKKNLESTSPTPKVSKKFINNWKQACDKTKDRTKELLKKWRTLPEAGPLEITVEGQSIEGSSGGNSTNWSEHVWATWVKRNSSEEDRIESNFELTEIQKKKLSHFFISYLDLDRDDFISLADLDAFTERLRHFSDWSNNSTEYHRLREVQQGFIETFMLPDDLDETIHSYDILEKKLRKVQLSIDQWLEKWTLILEDCRNFGELPPWLQYFPKILFNAINKSGNGKISKDEISAFFASLLSLPPTQLEPFLDEAFNALTSKNQYSLTYSIYRLSFANFIFGRYINGPGQYMFGPMPGLENYCFPIDYKFLNLLPTQLEQYSRKVKSNRTSIIV